MPSPSPSDDELLLKCHFVYELTMLRDTYQRCPKEGTIINDDIIRNALIESFCVHARNLIEFFEGEKNESRKYSESAYHPFSTVMSDIRIGVIKKRLNAQITHLIYHGTHKRTINDSEKINDKDRADIYTIVARENTIFKTHLAQGYKHIAIPD